VWSLSFDQSPNAFSHPMPPARGGEETSV